MRVNLVKYERSWFKKNIFGDYHYKSRTGTDVVYSDKTKSKVKKEYLNMKGNGSKSVLSITEVNPITL